MRKVHVIGEPNSALLWRVIRDSGVNITSAWIETPKRPRAEISATSLIDASSADILLILCRENQIPYGALHEAAIALSKNKEVRCINQPETINPGLTKNQNWRKFASLREAIKDLYT